MLFNVCTLEEPLINHQTVLFSKTYETFSFAYFWKGKQMKKSLRERKEDL